MSHVTFRRDVDGDELSADLLRGRRTGGLVDIGAHDARTLGREAPDRGQPDAAAGSRDDCNLAREPAGWVWHDVSLARCQLVEMNTFLVSVNASGASGP